jgi:hypothetical protein
VTPAPIARHPARRGAGALLLAVATLGSAADPPVPPPKQAIAPPAGAPKSDPPTVPFEKYRELQERFDRLQARFDAVQPVRPRACELEGRVEQRGPQAVVRLRATFKVTTTRPDVLVHLGCQRAHAVEARGDDGKTPLLSAADDGLRVQFPAAGDHTVKLDLDLPVGPRGPKGAELGFELGLPGAAITALTFEPPANVQRYTLTTRLPQPAVALDTEVEQAEADRFLPGKGGAPLGPITSLALTWEDPSRKAEAVRSADADVTVTVGPDEVTTEARLRLRGGAAQWRFTAPATADVTVGPWVGPGAKTPPESPPGRVPNVVRPEPGQTVWRVENREPTGADLLAVVTTRVPRTRDRGGRGPVPIGPFAVLDVTRQAGVIRVRTPLTWKAAAELRGDVKKETDDGSGEAVYRYRYPPLKAAPSDAPVVLTLSPAAGVVHGRVRHVLRLAEGGWKLRSEVSLAPSRAEVATVQVEVPEGFRLADVEPREIVEEFVPDPAAGPGRQLYRVRLTAPRRASFTFTLHGDYSSGPTSTAASLQLPRVLGIAARGSDVVVEGPAGLEVRGTFRAWGDGHLGAWDTPLDVEPADVGRRIHGSAEGFIGRVDLRWQPAAATARVAVVADVDFGPNLLLVTERLTCRFPGRVPERVGLTAGVRVADVRAARGAVQRVGDGWDLLPADGASEAEFVLTYSAPRPADGVAGGVPLLVPEGGAVSQHVRLWAAPGGTILLAEAAGWRTAPVEVVPDRPALPDLVLRADGPAAPPAVVLGPGSRGGEAGPLVEGVQIEARLGETVTYRARFLLGDSAAGAEFRLPAGARAVETFVQGRRLPDAAGAGESATVRVPPVTAPGERVVVELHYRLADAGHLEAPHLTRGEVAGDVTWVIVPRPGWVALRAGDVSGGWSAATFRAVLGVGERPDRMAEAGPSLAVRRADLGSLNVYEVRRLPWLLSWSLAAGLCGLAIAVAGRRLRRLVALGALIAGFVAAFVCPQPLAAAVAAALPGLLGFAVLALGYRAFQVRYRHRLARSAGFARPGSSLIRPSATRASDSSPRGSSAIPVAPASAP